jgi:4-oxalocrotonate tautomerase
MIKDNTSVIDYYRNYINYINHNTLIIMPLITFEAGKLSSQVKSELIQKLTEISSEITGIPKSSFFISIREMPDENVVIGGKTVHEIKKELGRL